MISRWKRVTEIYRNRAIITAWISKRLTQPATMTRTVAIYITSLGQTDCLALLSPRQVCDSLPDLTLTLTITKVNQ